MNLRVAKFPPKAVIAIVIACTVPLIFTPKIEVSIAPDTMRSEIGSAYIVPLPSRTYGLFAIPSDDNDAPLRSKLDLYENGRPLGPSHAQHEVIRRDGTGAYSHWRGSLYFSASDNSDPRTNGRVYVASAETRIVYFAKLTLLLIIAFCLAVVGLDLQRRFGAMLWSEVKERLASPAIALIRALRLLPGVLPTLAGGLRSVALATGGQLRSRIPRAFAWLRTSPATLIPIVIAGVLPLILTPTIQVSIAPGDVHRDVGNAFVVPIPLGTFGVYMTLSDDIATPSRSKLILYENERPLGPSHAQHDVIRRDGSGAYSHWRGSLYFSASDNSDPRANGRRYSASSETQLPRLIQIALLVVLGACLGALTRVLHDRLGGMLDSVASRGVRNAFDKALTPVPLAVIVTVLALAIACLCGLQYRTHDDALARMIAEGVLGDRNQREFIILQNVIVGLALRVAYDWLAALPWYDVELVGACIAGALLCQIAVFRLGTVRSGLLLCAAIALLFLTPIFQAIQFTAAAMLLAGGAVLMAGSLWVRPPRKRAHLWAACALIVLAFLCGALIRHNAALLVLLTMLPVFALIGRRRFDRRVLMPVAAVGCAIAAAFLARAFEAEYFRHAPGWDSYLGEAELRKTVTEWAHLDRSRQADFHNALAAAHWTENDYRMLSGWLYADRQTFSVERMRAFNELAPRLPIAVRVENMLHVLAQPASLFWLFAAVCLAPVLLRRSGRALAGAVVTIVWTAAILIIAGVLFKTDLLHITWPLYATLALASAGMTLAAEGRASGSSRVSDFIVDLVFFGIALSVVWMLSDLSSRSAAVHATRKSVSNDIAAWPVRAGDTVVVWDNNFPFVNWARPFRHLPETPWRFLDTFSPSTSPLFTPLYAAWGTNDIAWAMCNFPRVFRVDALLGYADRHAKILATHMRERHGQQIDSEVVFRGATLALHVCRPGS